MKGKIKYIIIITIILITIIVTNGKKENIIVYNSYNDIVQETFHSIENSKVIIIGDSRFRRIVRDKEYYNIPSNFTFIAKSATGIDWFKNEAIDKLKTMITDNNIDYHVIINMGVNDIEFEKDYKKTIEEYKNEIDKLKKEYPNIKYYILSINPIDEEIINDYFPENTRKEIDIEYFNKELNTFSKKKNITYCDSYNNIGFSTLDGLHYTEETNQDILYFIANKCINYSKDQL